MKTIKEQRVAVIGASQDRSKFGNKCVRAYDHAGWTVYPINPNAAEIENLRAFPLLAALPEPVERICIYLPPPVTAQLLERLPHGPEVYFNPGSANADLLAEARELGLDVHDACAIVAIGLSPSQFPG
jgi:predicted CoA-binding protein